MPIEYLSQFDLLQIRTRLAAAVRERFDLLNLDGLLSALAAPRQVVFGQELHPALLDKAATLLYLLIKNHPFYDGNKRIAVLALREFLRRNGVELTASEAEAAALARSIVLGDRDVAAAMDWLAQHTRELDDSAGRGS